MYFIDMERMSEWKSDVESLTVKELNDTWDIVDSQISSLLELREMIACRILSININGVG